MIQGSPEWFAARVGKLTASRVADMMARTRNGWGASRANYLAQLVAERLTGTPAESFTNTSMLWGTEKEPEARLAYEFRQGVDVTEVGFIDHPRIAMSGASPDGLVGDDGLVEIKAPNTATHIDTLLSGSVPDKYVKQMTWQMACTGRGWCDWVSYDPRMPESMRLYVRRVERDEKLITQIEDAAQEFLAEVEKTVALLTTKYGEQREAA